MEKNYYKMELSYFNDFKIKKMDDLDKVNNPKQSLITNKSKQNNKKSLPENFFKKVIEYEMKLKYDFTMEALNELVDLFSAAIEYYESKDDEKYRDYQNRLNNLLSQPDILKNINRFNNNKNKNSSISGLEKKMVKEKQKKQIQMKINYISQINKLGENKKLVTQIMEDFKKPEDKINIDYIVGDDITKQENDFKSRLLAKRQKKGDIINPLLTNGIDFKMIKEPINDGINEENEHLFDEQRDKKTFVASLNSEHKRENCKTNFISGLNNIVLDLNNDSKIKENEDKGLNNENEIIKEKIVENIGQNLEKCSNLNENLTLQKEELQVEEKEKNQKTEFLMNSSKNTGFNYENIVKISNKSIENADLDKSFERLEKAKLDEIDDLFSPFDIKNSLQKNSHNSQYNNSLWAHPQDMRKESKVAVFKLHEKDNILETKGLSNKYRIAHKDIHTTIESFVSQFNYLFYDHVFQKFTDNIKKLMDEKYTKYIEISMQYNSQIKEMEFLLNGDNEDTHAESINAIIVSLKDEQAHELDRIDDQFNKLVNDAENTFKNSYVKNNPGIQLLEEKFRLEMYNLINSILLPKK